MLSSRLFSKLLIRRAAQSLVLVILLIVLNFLLIHTAPGDPVYFLAGQSGDESYYNFIRAKFGLDEPLATQLWVYLSSVARGDLGYSLSRQQPVFSIILARVPATLLLVLPAILLASVLGIVLGTETARRENSLFDRLTNTFALLGHSLPSFSIAMLLLLFFSLYLGLFPAQGFASADQSLTGLAFLFDLAMHLALPVLTLTIIQLALILRLTRTEMVNTLGENYVTTARAKGVPEEKVVYGHALRNALLPVVTVVGSEIGMTLSGAVLVETVFAYPGLGRLMLEAMAARDYPIVLGLFLMISISVVVINLITDLVYPLIDPRIEYGR